MTTIEMNPLQHQHHEYLCDDCEMEIAEHDFLGSCDIAWRLCEQCNKEALEVLDDARMAAEERRREEEEANQCERCHCKRASVLVYTSPATSDDALHLCEDCSDEEEEEDLGVCRCCRSQEATISFMHITNGNFELCDGCFQAADHEPEYGRDFVKDQQ